MAEPDSTTPPAEFPPRPRPIRLFDLMVLVVAAAMGIAWLRSRTFSTSEFGLFQQRNPAATDWSWLLGPLYQARWWATPILAPLTLALGVLWMQPPRPGLGRQVRRAGWVVAPLVAIVFGLQWAIVGGHSVVHPSAAWWIMETSAIHGQDWAGPSILLAWLALALAALAAPRVRERSWLDTAGRALGLAWVFVWLIGLTGPACIAASPAFSRAGLLPAATGAPQPTGISLGGPRASGPSPGRRTAPAIDSTPTDRTTAPASPGPHAKGRRGE